LEIKNPIDEETTEMLKKVYFALNKYLEEKNRPYLQRVQHIKILKTFAF
jgi:hypothetical protein